MLRVRLFFSNDPEKYYYFSVLEQFDLERLVIFRQATITIHLQPFKYKVNEATVDLLTSSGVVVNSGNVKSKPILELEGSGTVEVNLNGSDVLQVVFDASNTAVTIDVETLEASNGDVLLNRICTGDYDNLQLNVGSNTFTFTGTVTTAEISRYSRWLG